MAVRMKRAKQLRLDLEVQRPALDPAGGPPGGEWGQYVQWRTGIIRAHAAPPAAVDAIYMMYSEKTAERISHCGKLWIQRREDGGHSWSPLRCRSRWCPSCANLWRADLLERLQAQELPEGSQVVLVTLTGGSTIPHQGLQERMEGMARAFRRWRRKQEKDGGILGGIYAWEVVPSKGRLHAHLHVACVVRSTAWWLQEDQRHLARGRISRDRGTGQLVRSPWRREDTLPGALLWLVATWADALEREAPALYADLPLARDLLPSLARWSSRDPWRALRWPARLAVCDIGGRWPVPGHQAELSSLVSSSPAQVFSQVVKYTVKGGGEKLSRPEWLVVLEAFEHRRRVQTWGALHGLEIPPEDEQEPEAAPPESTGLCILVHSGTDSEFLRVRHELVPGLLRAYIWRAAGCVPVGEQQGLTVYRFDPGGG